MRQGQSWRISAWCKGNCSALLTIARRPGVKDEACVTSSRFFLTNQAQATAAPGKVSTIPSTCSPLQAVESVCRGWSRTARLNTAPAMRSFQPGNRSSPCPVDALMDRSSTAVSDLNCDHGVAPVLAGIVAAAKAANCMGVNHGRSMASKFARI